MNFRTLAAALALALAPVSCLAQAINWGSYDDADQVIYVYFNTVGSDGVAETLTGGTVEIYEDGGATQITTAETLDNDFDSVTGFHQLAIDLADAGFEANKTYTVILTGGTVDSVSVAGRILGVFSVNRVVDANVTQILGEAVDASPTPLDVNVVSTDAGAITATSFAAGAIDAAATAADFITEVKDQVVAALSTDTYAEPTGVPAATDDLATKISYLYNFLLRNRIDVTATKKTYYGDDGAAEFEKDLSDDGTTYSETEVNAP